MSAPKNLFTSFEQEFADRQKYKSFFTSEKELELFLRIPLNDKHRHQVLESLAKSHESGEDENKTELSDLTFVGDEQKQPPSELAGSLCTDDIDMA